MAKRLKPDVFAVNLNPFNVGLLVVVNHGTVVKSAVAARKFLKKSKLRDEMTRNRVLSLIGRMEKDDGDFYGSVYHGQTSQILCLPEFRDDWSCWEVLLHEVHHVVWNCLKASGVDDNETAAYLFGETFHKLRKILVP